MGTTTSKLKLIKPYESDYVSISDLNSNMDTIDGLVHIVEGGTATGTVSISSTTQSVKPTWYYQKTDDGLLKAWTYYATTALICNTASDDQFRSRYIRFDYPSLNQDKIINRSVYVSVLRTSYNETSNGTTTTKYAHYYNTAVGAASYPTQNNYDGYYLYDDVKETVSCTKYIYVSFVATWK